MRPFQQVDVFSSQPLRGNPVAVVHDARGPDHRADGTLHALDQPVRGDVPAAAHRYGGGLCGAHLHAARRAALRRASHIGHLPCLARSRGSAARCRQRIVQECPAGLIPIRRIEGMLAFAAPPRQRSGPVAGGTWSASRASSASASGHRRQPWVDNGPGWVAVMLRSAEAVLALAPERRWRAPRHRRRRLVSGRCRVRLRGAGPLHRRAPPDDGGPGHGQPQCLARAVAGGSGRVTPPYTASQGTALGRAGPATHQRATKTAPIWVGGATTSSRRRGEYRSGGRARPPGDA